MYRSDERANKTVNLNEWVLWCARAARRVPQSSFHQRASCSFWPAFELAHLKLALLIANGTVSQQLIVNGPRAVTDVYEEATHSSGSAHCLSAANKTCSRHTAERGVIEDTEEQSDASSGTSTASSSRVSASVRGHFDKHSDCHGACAALALTPLALASLVAADPVVIRFGHFLRAASARLQAAGKLTFFALTQEVADSAPFVFTRQYRLQLHHGSSNIIGNGCQSNFSGSGQSNFSGSGQSNFSGNGGQSNASGSWQQQHERFQAPRNLQKQVERKITLPFSSANRKQFVRRHLAARAQEPDTANCGTAHKECDTDSSEAEYAAHARQHVGCAQERQVLRAALQWYARNVFEGVRFPCLLTVACFFSHHVLWQQLRGAPTAFVHEHLHQTHSHLTPLRHTHRTHLQQSLQTQSLQTQSLQTQSLQTLATPATSGRKKSLAPAERAAAQHTRSIPFLFSAELQRVRECAARERNAARGIAYIVRSDYGALPPMFKTRVLNENT